MRYPKFLKDNGVVGVCAPSFGANREPYISRMNNSFEILTGLGYDVSFSDSVKSRRLLRSASGSKRAKEFTSMYSNDDVDVIISEAGGEVACEMIDKLNFKLLSKKDPKWFMGNSDNTWITFLLPTLMDVASIYGYCFTKFGMEPWHESVLDHYKMLRGEKLNMSNYRYYQGYKWEVKDNPLCCISDNKESIWHSLSGEKEFNVEGRVIGGCLDILSLICGTKFDNVASFVEKYKDEGIIWFVESCDLNILDQLRVFWKLKNAGWFKYAKAIIIGRPYNKKTMFSTNYKRANYSELKSLNIPVVIDADFGHIDPSFPIMMGAYGRVSYNEGKFDIEYILK